MSAYLHIIKVDTETGKNIALADTSFKILNLDTNEYVSQFVKDEIIERSLDICNEINLDSTIFSKNVLMLQPIVIKFNKVCDNLYKSYQNSLIELKEESYEVDNGNEL